MNKTAYLLIDADKIQILQTIEEVKELEFENLEKTDGITIFEIEFKKKINFKPKVKIELTD